MTVSVQYLRAVMHALLVILWTPAVVYAGTSSLQHTIDTVSGSLILVLALLSSLSGATALVMRIDKQLRVAPDARLPLPWLFAASHMLGSYMATALAFMLIEGSGMLTGWHELAFITTASFMGAKFIELVVEKFLLKGFT